MNAMLEANHTWIIRQKIFQLLGKTFYINSREGELLGFAKQDPMSNKIHLRVYDKAAPTHELFAIARKHILQTDTRFQVIPPDAAKHQISLDFTGMRSFRLFTRNNWQIHNEHEQAIGTLVETGGDFFSAANLVRDMYSIAASRKFRGQIGDDFTFDIQDSLSPLFRRITLNVASHQTDITFRRLALACALIVCDNRYIAHRYLTR